MASRRHIFFLLSLLGVISACTILYMLFWLTDRIDQIENGKIQALVQLQVKATSNSVRLGVEDYAFWTHAHELVQSGDDDGILEDLGSGATDSELFDQLFILNPEGELQHAFDETLGAEAHTLYDKSVFWPMWQQLTSFNPADYPSVTSVIERDGAFSLAVIAWITPDEITPESNIPLSSIFGVIHLSEDRLQSLINSPNVSAFSLTEFIPENLQTGSDNRTILYDINDAPIAMLSWQLLSTGASLRQELLPAVILVVAIIVAICGLAGRYFRDQYLALRQANVVATTDKLTGLLNRDGLAERLRTKNISDSLERGHLAVIYFDLNKFKKLNDTYGHEAGDIALRVTADRLRSAVRKSDTVVRLGGDEFICVVVDKNPENAAVSVARRIMDLSKSPMLFGEHTQVITTAAGLVVTKPNTHWDTLLSQADAAMYWAKQHGADFPVVFGKSMDGESGSNLARLSKAPRPSIAM